ncbi:Sarcosine dehydrogenase [Candidatus Rhodobacter oscarellae]|uniref:Sarcosine dehydrogenase n=1 Tax=Candidatus Rhodobacter oscarellae TaxID=1675527 RepID=A0A0J9E966_9RHOB|nr:FAD-dependent oxidoreductase [Candidatus Rhodobacter lobularis]KMW59337.1 Sarcosine dehydrogenase [Candidatus Rhodobacter lobularis]
MPEFPSHARTVIVGGGIMGCGLAYHLAHEGWSNVVLLEKAELTSGSTWHAAGQITHSTSSFGLGKCVDYNIGLYAGALEAETGQSVTWHGCGSFRLAYTEDEMDWLRHTLSVGRALGFNIELVDPAFIARLHPFYNLEGVLGALYTPDDGHVDPSGVTQALAAGARAQGARIIRRCRATNITRQGNGEWLVETEQGAITCEHVVNAGGTYARQMGEWSGLLIPTTSMTHHYFVTDPVPEFADLDTELPVIRDDKLVSGYIRMEQKKGLIGIYEKENPNTVWEDHCPWEAENELFAADYDRVMPWLENAMGRMPVLAELGIQREVHGAISHPPDGNPLVGPVAGAPGYWCACGTQIGIGWGPGLTRELARWMVHGAADISMREFDPRRFGPYATKEWQVVKAREDYCLRHEIPFPHFNRLAGRPVKTSPLYEVLKAKGAVHEEVFGWERPRFFDGAAGASARDTYSFRRSAVDALVAGEVRACREAAGIMDISSFAKIEVSGPMAAATLDPLVANRLPAPGRMVLTHLLNRRGRIEAEVTIVRLREDAYYITCAAFFEQRVMDHLATHNRGAKVACLSQKMGALALQGPRARAILSRCTDAPLGNAQFKWLTHQRIAVAGHQVEAIRMSYGGELGWELHMPMAAVRRVYDALMAAGAPLGLRDYGSFAMNAMRMEKMFKGAGELTNEVTLPEADVMRFVRTDKAFLGKEATLAGSLRWVCAYLEIEPDGEIDGHGGEAVLWNGDPVGATSSVAFGPTVGKVLAFAYIKPEAAQPGTALEVVIHGQPRRARVLAEPAYDPASALPRTDATPQAAE